MSNTIFYTYWFDEWASIVSLLKKFHNEFKSLTLFSRAHRFDLYSLSENKSYIFPRKLQLQGANAVFSISEHGRKYLQKRHLKYRNKVFLSRLGVDDSYDNYVENRIKPMSEILMVSCSDLRPIKRVELIIKMLRLISHEVRWVHFGGGVLMSELKKKADALPRNITVDFRGNVDNLIILDFYKKHKIDMFLNTSESEGIPVSIMEAISFGIPILATDVGGVSEIVNSETGMLIDKNFDCDEVSKKMIRFIRESGCDEFRKKSINFCNNNYSAKKNFTDFAKTMTKIQ